MLNIQDTWKRKIKCNVINDYHINKNKYLICRKKEIDFQKTQTYKTRITVRPVCKGYRIFVNHNNENDCGNVNPASKQIIKMLQQQRNITKANKIK